MDVVVDDDEGVEVEDVVDDDGPVVVECILICLENKNGLEDHCLPTHPNRKYNNNKQEKNKKKLLTKSKMKSFFFRTIRNGKEIFHFHFLSAYFH